LSSGIHTTAPTNTGTTHPKPDACPAPRCAALLALLHWHWLVQVQVLRLPALAAMAPLPLR